MFRQRKPVSSGSLTTTVSHRINSLRAEHGAIACGDAQERAHACFVGEVMSTRIVPRGMSHWFEVVIGDGSGKINGWFFGRRQIAGMELGSVVLFKGLVQMDQGELTIANPYYEFV